MLTVGGNANGNTTGENRKGTHSRSTSIAGRTNGEPIQEEDENEEEEEEEVEEVDAFSPVTEPGEEIIYPSPSEFQETRVQ